MNEIVALCLNFVGQGRAHIVCVFFLLCLVLFSHPTYQTKNHIAQIDSSRLCYGMLQYYDETIPDF